MANIKISAAADAGSLLSSDMLPLARAGNTNAYHATMAEVATFTNAAVAAGTYGNVGRNQLHNGRFIVTQRGSGPWTTQGYNLDRWWHQANLDTISIAAVAVSDAQRASFGDEAADICYDNTFTGNAGAAAFNALSQRIEDLRRLSGKQVTVSFWAWCAVAPKSLGVSIDQIPGTGGSPSANVLGTGTAVTITTTPTRYSATFTIGSAAGLTLGTNKDDCTELNIWFSSGTTNASRAGSIGVQSGHIALWGVQLEVGSAATPLERLDPASDLANCLRFFQAGTGLMYGYGTAGTFVGHGIQLPVIMRAPPTVVASNFTTTTNLSSPSFGIIWNGAISMAASVTASGAWGLQGNYQISADL